MSKLISKGSGFDDGFVDTIENQPAQMSIEDVVNDVPELRSIASNLRDLLAQARRLKQSNDINPPLQIADFERDVINVVNFAESDADVDLMSSGGPRHAALETAARNIFYEHLAAFATDEASFVDICNLLDILQFCANLSQCDTSLPLWLVEELLDSQTIGGCKRVFDYLESRRERMITDTFHKNKQMIVLRSCNELLRRLSRAEDAVFCGRVFMFLFQSFPLGDKSSVNLRGEFHVENTTTFDTQELVVGKAEVADEMEVDNGHQNENLRTAAPDAPQSDDTKADNASQTNDTMKIVVPDEKLDGQEILDVDTLYSVFWSLQSIFSNPTKVFVVEEFSAFRNGLDATIQKFKSVNKVLQTQGSPKKPRDGRQGVKRKRNRSDDELASNFNPKYLTSRDLFELEMSDLTFQRHILVQALILIDFLLSLTPKAKRKLAELKAQKAMVYNYTLSPEDTTWATTMRSIISNYLQEGPEGKFYYRMIDIVLSRDKNWVRWKTESCPPISLPALPTTFYTSALNGARRACAPRRLRATPMGSIDLGFLTEETGPAIAEKRLEALKNPKRYTHPGMEKYLGEIGAVDLDLEMANPEEKKELSVTRASMTWRLFRLAAKTKLKALSEINERGSLDMLNPKPKDMEEDGGGGVSLEGEQQPLASSTDDKNEPMDDIESEPNISTSIATFNDQGISDNPISANIPQIKIEKELAAPTYAEDRTIAERRDAEQTVDSNELTVAATDITQTMVDAAESET